MIPNLPIQQRIAELRIKARSPEGLTLEETREAITFLRGERLAMPQKPPSSRKATPIVDEASLLSELGL